MPAVHEQATAEVELSVVVPTYRRPGRLRTCLESLMAQEPLPERVELVVVLDGPDHETEEMLASLTPPFPMRVVVQNHARQAAARNRGAEEARGRYVLFLDDDVVAGPTVMSAHLEAL